LTYEFKQFPNWGYCTKQLSEKNLQPIIAEVDSILNQETVGEFNEGGHVEMSYWLSERTRLHLEYLMVSTLREYRQNDPAYLSSNQPKLTVSRVNLYVQQPQESMGLHRFQGAFNWCLFLRVPYTLENERQHDRDRSGLLELSYTDVTGSIIHMAVPADRSWEGRLIIYPGNVSSTVYPFRSTPDARVVLTGALLHAPQS
jgi:hypothetical protein